MENTSVSGYLLLFLRILSVIILYGFLGYALYTLWRDLKIQSSLLMQRKIPPIVITEFSEGEQKTTEFKIAEIIIGREKGCDILLSDETVSNRHARISYHHNQWWVEDLGSKNGTYINDENLHSATVIISGDEIRCGIKLIGIEIKGC